MCNEVIAAMPFERQCEYAAKLGYAGLEVAPYTLAEDPAQIAAADAQRYARVAADHGIAICGLHWLLVAPKGLSISTPDDAVRRRTLEVMLRLVDLCAQMGGAYLVHGSPGQRRISAGETKQIALERAKDCWARAGAAAAKAGVTYCIEPLSSSQTPLVNTLGEAVAIVQQLGLPALRTMLDTSSAGQEETLPVAQLIDRWFPTGCVAHVQLNDRNRRGPGQGEDRFAPVLAALKRNRYQGWLAMEPFDYQPDGPGSAARAIGYVQGILEGLEP